MQTKNVYGMFDLGHGLHISLDPEHYDALIANVFVVQTSLGKINPPSKNSSQFQDWFEHFDYLKIRGKSIVTCLNDGTITESQAIELIKELNT